MRAVTGRLGIWAVLLAALALAGGCSSSGSTGDGSGNSASTGDSSGSSGSGGALKGAFETIHGSLQTVGYFEYGDTARVVKLSGGIYPVSDAPFRSLLGYGSSRLTQWETILPPLVGFDSLTAGSAISVGKAPNTVSILYGSFDPAAIGAKLAAWGYHQQDRGDGLTAWVFQDDHKIDMSGLDPATGLGPGMGGWLNVIWVSKSRIVYGGATSDLAAALTGPAKPLSEDATVGGLAGCLGSPLAALMVTDQTLIQSAAVSAIAFGVTGTGTADAREEICVAAPNAAKAQNLAAEFTKAVGSGFDLRTNQPWSAQLSDPQTAVLGGPAHLVRLTAKPVDGPRVHLVFDLAAQSDYLPLLGFPDAPKTPSSSPS